MYLSMKRPVKKSAKLADVFYDIRGPVLEMAQRLEREGREIIRLNIGNLAAFGLEPPNEIVAEMIRSLPEAAGYTDSKGLVAPREAIGRYAVEKGIRGVTIDDIYIGNGASELIVMSLNACLTRATRSLSQLPIIRSGPARFRFRAGGRFITFATNRTVGCPISKILFRKSHRRLAAS